MSTSLDGPLAKLDRAYEHLESLDLDIAAFFATKPYSIVPERDTQTGEHVFRLRIREDPPLRLGTIVGDFATNTRAALDHLVWQLVILNGQTPSGKTCFPIHKTKPKVAHDPKGPIGRVSARHRAVILNYQPYHAGNKAEDTGISLLSWLVNTDKHRVVHSTYGFLPTPDAAFFTFKTPGGLTVPSTYDHIAIAKGRRAVDGAEIARVKLPDPDLEAEMHGSFPLDIAFGERWMRATALPEIYNSVREFVEFFAPDFT